MTVLRIEAAALAVLLLGCDGLLDLRRLRPDPDAGASATHLVTTGSNGASGSCDPGCLPSACSDPGARVTASLVSGLESGCASIDLVDGRDGYWFTYGNTESIITPQPGMTFVPSCIGAAGSCHAACITGRISGDNYPYATVGLNFRSTPTIYDLSPYSGASFYLSGHVGALSEVRFAVRLASDTEPGLGGTCTSGCNDPYQLTVPSFGPGTEHDAFVQVQVPFSGLTQLGFGASEAWDPRAGIGMSWSVVAAPGQMVVSGDEYSLCVDQVELLPK